MPTVTTFANPTSFATIPVTTTPNTSLLDPSPRLSGVPAGRDGATDIVIASSASGAVLVSFTAANGATAGSYRIPGGATALITLSPSTAAACASNPLVFLLPSASGFDLTQATITVVREHVGDGYVNIQQGFAKLQYVF